MKKLKYVDVYDHTIAAMLCSEELPYLYREDGEPYRFIGEEAAKRALYWDNFVNTEVPVKLTIKEIFVLSKILKDIPLYDYYFGISGCGDKLDKAVFDRTDKK